MFHGGGLRFETIEAYTVHRYRSLATHRLSALSRISLNRPSGISPAIFLTLEIGTRYTSVIWKYVGFASPHPSSTFTKPSLSPSCQSWLVPETTRRWPPSVPRITAGWEPHGWSKSNLIQTTCPALVVVLLL